MCSSDNGKNEWNIETQSCTSVYNMLCDADGRCCRATIYSLSCVFSSKLNSLHYKVTESSQLLSQYCIVFVCFIWGNTLSSTSVFPRLCWRSDGARVPLHFCSPPHIHGSKEIVSKRGVKREPVNARQAESRVIRNQSHI